MADDEPLGLADPHLLDPQVAGNLLVAALALQGGGRFGRAGAQPLPDDVVVVATPQVAAVWAEAKPRSATQMTRARVQSRRSCLTWRMRSAESVVLPGQHHTRTGIPARVTAMPITICGRSSRWSLDLP